MDGHMVELVEGETFRRLLANGAEHDRQIRTNVYESQLRRFAERSPEAAGVRAAARAAGIEIPRQ